MLDITAPANGTCKEWFCDGFKIDDFDIYEYKQYFWCTAWHTEVIQTE